MTGLVLPHPSRARRRRNTWIQVGLLALLVLPPASLWVYEATDGFAVLRPMRVSGPEKPIPFPWTIRNREDVPLASRTLAVVEGPFAYGHPVTADLFLIRNGVVTECGSAMSGRSVEPRPRYRMLRVMVGLGEAEVPDGRLSVLSVRGGSRAGGWPQAVHTVRPRFRATFTGTIPKGATRLLYVEGDRKFAAVRGMTVEEFARANEGEFLAVTVTRN